MNRKSLLALTAILAVGASVPAMAAWDRIGSVDFSYRTDRATQYSNFGGSVESLSLRAHDSAVTCSNVQATFGNGETRRVFRGTLPLNRDVRVDLPGDQRLVRRLDFTCHAAGRRGATVDISADVGRYQAEWRNSPNWQSTWARIFRNWTNIPPTSVSNPMPNQQNNPNGWMILGTESFEGRADQETTFAGMRGQQVEKIGLRATNDDARCTRVTAKFQNGQTAVLNVGNGGMMMRDRMISLDLPGDDRNVTGVTMNCHAEHGRQVAIQVFAADPDRTQDRNGPRRN